MYPLKTQETTNYGTTYRFQEEDAADGFSIAPFGPCKSTRQFLFVVNWLKTKY